jgi:hypothetical protein
MTATTSSARVTTQPHGVPSAGVGVTFVAWSMVVWSLGFAVVNVVFEVTGRFADGPYNDYASGISVMNWLVVVLKVTGAVLAVLSVSSAAKRVPRFLLATMLWGAAATLGLDALGSVVEAIGMLTGVIGSPDEITVASSAYVLFFALGAVGYGVVAASFTRRSGTGRRPAVLGALGAPVMLGLIFLAIPKVLVTLGVMPA